MSARLELLTCPGCAAPVPLGAGPTVACPSCAASVAIPEAYVRLAEATLRADQARRAAEPVWRALGGPPPAWARNLAMALVVLLPPLASVLVALLVTPALGAAEICAVATLPAVVPGAALWLWAASVGASVEGVRAALAAAPPARAGGPATCRHCGAPLQLSAGALSVTCSYCQADNLAIKAARAEATQASSRLGAALHSLADGSARLRMRRVMLGLGALALCGLFGGAAVLVLKAVRSLHG
ncbi:MAG: hypothetical protein IT370_25395 [Deltaproteobacteria bacterium]|nr:hypothetical protein [Deltaproteobacteria bacterium]